VCRDRRGGRQYPGHVGLQSFEGRVENMVDSVFSRAFKSSLRPIELGRKLVREMENHRSVDVKGRTIVPNSFSFQLSPQDAGQFAEIDDALVRELCDAAREYARDEGYWFMGPVSVELLVGDDLRPGRFRLESRMQEGPSGVGPGSLVLPSGERVRLGDRAVSIGRLPECDVPLADPNVSRRHAEVRPSGTGYAVVDLNSTNGTRVNGVVVGPEAALRDGDVITVGATRIRFEAS
jgi:FhaA, N-terminal domain/FHA domain